MNVWVIILKVLAVAGSLGLFLFGMKLMSESLQKVAGKRIRKILSAISSRPFKGILSGLLITGVIQSSSATTVMVVSFVNAGLMTLLESFGIIMGANIGTTVTGWIISLLGFGRTFDIDIILLPLIALSLPLLFSIKSELRSWSEFIIGFALLFLGLSFLKDAAPLPANNPEFIDFISNFRSFGYGSVLLFVLIGIVLTVIFQSSSAMMAFTFVIAIDGWIPFDLAAAMVLGENLGTTVTANIAAIVGNIEAKRSAFFHFLFNLIGVIWALLLFKLLVSGVDRIILAIQGSSPFVEVALVPVALSLFHTVFNVLNTLLLIGLLKYLETFIRKLIISKNTGDIEYRLKYIESFYVSTSELSTVQAKKEIIDYGKLVYRMYQLVPELLMEKRTKKFERLYGKIGKYEDIIDNIEIEIASYLTRLSESKLSLKSTRQIQVMLKIITSLESIGDACYNLARTIKSKNENKIYFLQDLRDNLNSLFDLTEKTLELMIRNLEKDYENVEVSNFEELGHKIKLLYEELQVKHIGSINNEVYSYQTGTFYINLIELLLKIDDHAMDVSEAITEMKNKSYSER
jgi:phosphate:Na+ symporter